MQIWRRWHRARGRGLGAAALAVLAAAGASGPVRAQDAQELEQRLRAVEARMAAQERRLREQEAVIAEQQRTIHALQAEPLDDQRAGGAVSRAVLTGLGPDRLLARETTPGPARAGGSGRGAERLLMADLSIGDLNPAPRHVGEAPPEESPVRQAAAMPEQAGVLTPRGQVLLEPIIDYSRTSSNRLVYRGVEIVPGVQLGVLEAGDADRNSGVFTLSGRYGLTNRLELEARVPYVYRSDRLTTVRQQNDAIARSQDVQGAGLGDIELALRYQLNTGADGAPIFIGAVRAKPPTGKGPYDVTYDEFGIAEDLARGSGFWGAEAGLTMLYPTDPAVIYAGLGFNHNIADDVDKTLGKVFVGRVDPGDSISANLGFGLALNPKFSVSLGYSHNYVFPTKTEIDGVLQESNSIQVGSMLMGLSYRLNEMRTLSANFEFGVTSDAPDVRFVVRAPLIY